MTKLSVLIFSKDDIDQALGLIRDVYEISDEVVLVDSSNADNRKMINNEAKKLPKLRILYVVAMGYPDALFLYGTRMCSNDWVLLLGIDERLSKKMTANIKGIIKDADCSAFAIRRFEEVKGDQKTRFFTWQIRLYKRDKATFKGIIHEQPKINGITEKIEDVDMYLSHVTELMHHEINQYQILEKFERYTYESYNEKVLEYMSKLDVSADTAKGKSSKARIILSLLNFYERITLKKKDQEATNFDYFMLQFARNLTYEIKAKSILGIVYAYKKTSWYMNRMKTWRKEPDVDENFEIAKIINDIGITKFLGLENTSGVEKLNEEYKNKKQGINVTLQLLKDRYRETVKKESRHK